MKPGPIVIRFNLKSWQIIHTAWTTRPFGSNLPRILMAGPNLTTRAHVATRSTRCRSDILDSRSVRCMWGHPPHIVLNIKEVLRIWYLSDALYITSGKIFACGQSGASYTSGKFSCQNYCPPPILLSQISGSQNFFTQSCWISKICVRSFKLRIHMRLLIHIALQNMNLYCHSFPSSSFSLKPRCLHSPFMGSWGILPLVYLGEYSPHVITDDPQQLNQLCDVGATNLLELSSTTAQRAVDRMQCLADYVCIWCLPSHLATISPGPGCLDECNVGDCIGMLVHGEGSA